MSQEPEKSPQKVWEKESETERVLLAHRELVTLAATDSMYRDTRKHKRWINRLLMVLGLYDRGKLNYLNIDTITNVVRLESLPDEFNGLRILQLGNLHLSNQDELLYALYPVLESIEYDLCILTGGIGLGLHDDVLLPRRAERLVKALKGNVFAVMGMGDTAQSMKVMREMGITGLNNEFETLTLMDRTIEIFGAECSSALIDPRFEDRLYALRESDLRLFVAANPQFRIQASRLPFDLMLTGMQSCSHCMYNTVCKWNHTARQHPTVRNDWSIHHLRGYTSSGLGRNHLDVRFRSRPELVVHELRT